MGLKEIIRAGSEKIKRDRISFVVPTTTNRYTSSLELGSANIITAIQSTKSCRLRLYGDSGSRNDINELARPFISQSVSSSISLIVDVDIDDTQPYYLTPVVFGLNLDTPTKSDIYFTVDSSSAGQLVSGDTISVTRMLLEDLNLPSINNRQTMIISASSLPSGSTITGSIGSPKTYLLYKVEPTAIPTRLRLYTKQNYRDINTELSRSFGTSPTSASGLIADIYMEDLTQTPMVPILLGRNDDDINSFTLMDPLAETYYTLTHGDSMNTTVSASLHIYSLED